MAGRVPASLIAAMPDRVRAGFAVAALGVVAYAGVLAADVTGPLREALPPVLYGLTALLCLARVPAAGQDRAAWALLGTGIALYGAGSVGYALAGERYPVGVPWFALAGWGLFYLFAFAAVIAGLRCRLRALVTSLALDGLIGALALAAVLAAVLVPEVLGDHEISLADAAAGLAYPAADLLLFGLALGACVFTGWRGDGSWRVLAAGCVLLLVGDVAVDVQAATGTYDDTSPVWAVFPAGMLLAAAAPWQTADRVHMARGDSFSVLAVPLVCFGIALAVIVADELHGGPSLADGLALAVLALAALRVLVTSRDLHRLRGARRFEHGFRDAEIGMALIGPDRRWLHVNDALCRTLGRGHDELVGIRADDLLHPSDRGAARRASERFASDEPPRSATYEMVLRRPDGRPLELLITTAVVPGDSGEPWYFSQAQDITERNRAQRHSAALAELGRLAIETSDPQALTAAAMRVVTRSLPCANARVVCRDPGTAGGVLTVPLRRREDGGFVVARRDALHGPFDELDVRFLQGVGDVLAGALDRAEAEEETRRQALHDPLTGLANRTSLADELDRALAVGRDQGRTTALVLMDLDRFKVVNDTLGHGTGDELLRLVAERLLAVTDAMDVVARLGGDEFVVVCPLLRHADDAVAAAQRLVDAFHAPFLLDGRELFVSPSAGVAVAGHDEASAEGLLRDADVAMYRAKEDGGGRLVLFDAALRARAVRRLSVEHALRRAVERDELVVHYQPIMQLEGGRLAGFEALVRWEHPEHGLVPPNEFIPVAEDTGLIRPIGAWVLETACRQLATWNRERPGCRPLRMSVNLSPRQLEPELPGLVAQTLQRTGTAPDQLVLEITESQLVEDDAQLQAVADLRRLGIAVALDDFGTGFSSLASVTAVELDSVKLDRSLIAGLGTSRPAETLVRAVVEMTSALGLEVVAEGLEDAAQLEAARALGCAYGQGWHLGRPVPADQAGELVAALAPTVPAAA